MDGNLAVDSLAIDLQRETEINNRVIYLAQLALNFFEDLPAHVRDWAESRTRGELSLDVAQAARAIAESESELTGGKNGLFWDLLRADCFLLNSSEPFSLEWAQGVRRADTFTEYMIKKFYDCAYQEKRADVLIELLKGMRNKQMNPKTDSSDGPFDSNNGQ